MQIIFDIANRENKIVLDAGDSIRCEANEAESFKDDEQFRWFSCGVNEKFFNPEREKGYDLVLLKTFDKEGNKIREISAMPTEFEIKVEDNKRPIFCNERIEKEVGTDDPAFVILDCAHGDFDLA